jgi:glucokinase
LILAGDVGGTKTYLARFKTTGEEPGPPLETEMLASASYASFEALLTDYLSRHPGPVKAIGLGVAGAVVNRAVRVTSLPWTIDSDTLAGTLGLKAARVHIINDLVATGHGLRALQPTELSTLQPGTTDEEACAGLIAAGTGLGETILVRVGVTHLPVPSEAGHADFAARTDDELRVFRALRERYGRVSWERVLSGPGLAALGAFFHEEEGLKAAWADHMKETGPGGPAAAVSCHGMARDCPACERALRLFVGVYGAEAGNLALRAVARAGIYLGGGIAPKILPALRWEEFRNAFRDKDHLKPLLATIPVSVVMNEHTGLLGAARYAAVAEA